MQCKNSEAIISNEYIDYITDYVVADDRLNGETLDYCFLPVNEQFRINYVNRSQLPGISVSSYYYYGIPKLYGLSQQEFNTLNLTETEIYQVQQPPLELTGRQVLIGFVDTGIRYTEDVFRDEFGDSRIVAIWDQSLEIPERAPEGFFYGSEFLQADINEALAADDPRDVVPSWDENGHGSRMAAVAAGTNLGENTFIGAAPDADILVVKLKQAKEYLRDYYLINEEASAFQENDIMLACRYLLQYARVFERPLVIVLGVGTNLGDHAGNSPLGKYLSDLNRQRNVAVVVAGGNEGNTSHHHLGNLRRRDEEMLEEQPAIENVEIRVGAGERGFVCELWGSGPDVFEIGIVSPGGERIPRISFNYQEGLSYNFVYERTQIDIDIVLVEEFSSQELIFMRFRDPTPGVWTIVVYHQGVLNNGVFHVWLPIQQFLSAETYFLTPNPYTTITEPGMAQEVFTVGSYNSESSAFAFFSGRGNNRVGYPKPALVAPGINVYTPFGVSTGSSIAAAFVAGAVADFMQWAIIEENAPLISGVGIRGYFVQGAERDPEVRYPNREWGYGRLNLNGVFVGLRR
ncbi:MAG: S8 family peptidase [Lachnospiraceae bacterium]|nr:S8 family peptidase [Lachnospiraceae bacterium]